MSVKPWCEGLAASTSISARGSYSGRSIATSGSGERYALDRRCQAERRGAPRPFQGALDFAGRRRSEEHTSELQSRLHLVCRLLLEKKKQRSISPFKHQLPSLRSAAISPSR